MAEKELTREEEDEKLRDQIRKDCQWLANERMIPWVEAVKLHRVTCEEAMRDLDATSEAPADKEYWLWKRRAEQCDVLVLEGV